MYLLFWDVVGEQEEERLTNDLLCCNLVDVCALLCLAAIHFVAHLLLVTMACRVVCARAGHEALEEALVLSQVGRGASVDKFVYNTIRFCFAYHI